MHRLSAATFDRFIRSLVVTAILLTTISTTDARSAAASPLTQKTSKPAPKNFVPPLPIVQHDGPAATKQSRLIYLPIRYKTWQAAPLSQSSSATLPQPAAAPVTPKQANEMLAATGPMFIENVGQFDPQARFLVRGGNGSLYLADDALWITALERPQTLLTKTMETDLRQQLDKDQIISGVNVKLSFVGATPHPRLEPFNRLDTHVSYFIGDDPTQWHADVPVWGGVRYIDLYPGIDLEIVSEQGQIQQRLIVRNESQLASVRLHVDGATSVALDSAPRHSHARLTTTIGEFTFPLFQVVGLSASTNVSDPLVTNDEISAPFAFLNSRGPGLNSPAYSRLFSVLAITNTSNLLYSTFLGGGGNDVGYGIAVDRFGNAYLAGTTVSTNFPTTTGTISETAIGGTDVFVAKINPTGGSLLYSTYLGTLDTDQVLGIALNTQGEAYITGWTVRNDFPTTPNAYRTTNSSGVFVTKLNVTATALLYSTYLGTGYGTSIAVDINGAIVVTGHTVDTAFPTKNAYQSQLAGIFGYDDAFISKIDPFQSGSGSLVYSTYLGGTYSDCSYYGARCGIAVDSNGIIYVTGLTPSFDFPTTSNAYSRSCRDGGWCYPGSDAFIAKIDPSQSGSQSLLYSTFLGGSSGECATGCSIAVDNSGVAYITGGTQSANFPTTPGAFQQNPPGYQPSNGFVAKLNTTKSGSASLVYATYLGGSGYSTYGECIYVPCSIAVDSNGAAYITGDTDSSRFPTTTLAYQPSYNGGSTDVFMAALTSDGSGLMYATYLGGNDGDTSHGIAVDADGAIYITGGTVSSNFPTFGSIQPYRGQGDVFVTKFLPTLLLDSMTRNCACPFCCPYSSRNHVGGPIDTLSGNYTYQKSDEAIPVLGGALEFKRSYSADTRDLFTRTLGYGWTHSQDIRLIFPTDPGGVTGQVQLQAAGGSQLPFFDLGNGGYQAYPGVTASMSRITATGGITTYVVTATNQTVYTFNSAGLVTQTINPVGNVITYTYYPTGSLQAVQSYGRSLRFYYDAQNRLQRVLDPINRATQFGYNANGDLAVVTDTRLLTWTYQYSGTTHLLTRILDPDQKIVERTEYDGQGRAIKQYNGKDELVVQLQFGAGGVITVTDGLTRTSVDRYGRGTWLGGTDSATQAITRTYDANFKPSFIADPNGNGPQMRWSANGDNLERITDARGYTTTMAYDSLNNLKQITDTRGVTTSYTYSGTILTRTVDALGNSTIYTYGQNSLLTAQQDALGRITQFENGTFGERKAITVTDASGAIYSVTRYQYDPVGRLITTTDPIGRITINSYNDGDQLIAVTNNYTTVSTAPKYLDTWNLITRYGYDGAGRQIAVTDTLNQVTRNCYDAAGRLISVTANFSPTVGQNYSNTYNLVTRYDYDAVGNRSWVTDTLMQATRTEYDNLNRPVTVTTNYKGNGAFIPSKSDENVIRITHYDPAGNVIEQIDPPNAGGEQRVTRTWYDSLNRVFSTTVNFTTTLIADPSTYNLTTWYEYDPAGNQTAITDTAKHVTRNYYDRVGRLISTTVNYSPTLGVNALNQFNLTTRYEYDAVGNRVAITDPVTLTTRYAFDALNRMVVMTQNFTITNGLDPNLYNLATRYQYDAIGNRLAVTDALTHTTVYTYDAVGRLSAEGNSVIGNVTRYQYDALGRTVVVTDPLTHPTRTYYDVAGRVVSTTNALTGTTVITYDALGRRVGVINENGKSSYTGYDGLGRTIAVTDATGSVTYIGYDALGNRIVVTDPLTHTTVFMYDIAGRLIAQRDAMTNTTRYGYDALGNRLVVTDANGIATGYGYDALNRLRIVTESLTTTLGLDATRYNVTTTYGYDVPGNRTVMTNARGYTTTYTYDALSRLLTLTDPLTHTTRYRYDAVGNRVAMTDALTQTTHYRHDELNRVTSITYTTGMSNVMYAYDKVGNRTFMTDSLGLTRYVYDELNRLKTATDPYNQTISYTYDAVGNRTNLTCPDGKVVTYTFDAANRLTNTLSWDGQNTTYQFDKAGRLITTTLSNGSRSVNAYDDADRLTRLTHARNNDTLRISEYQYGVDAVSNRRVTTETQYAPGFSDGFETADFSRWSGAVTNNGMLQIDTWVVSEGAYSMAATIEDTNPMYVRDDTPNSETHYSARFSFNPTGGAALRQGSQIQVSSVAHDIFVGRTSSVDTLRIEVRQTMEKLGATYSIRALARTDSTTEVSTGWYTLPAGYYTAVTIDWQASTAAGASDGVLRLGLNDVLKETVTGIDNDTRRIDEARLGPSAGIDTGTYMTEYYDAFTSQDAVTATIQFTYDPLYRLTNANYSGSYTYTFGYGYDKVGNRTVQTRTITNTQVTNYTYDAANRLSSAGGVNYTWDNNGNLTNDGSSLYRYDQANRLISTTLSGATILFNYNGDGVRLRQIVAGVPTTYTQDLAAPLPVVLQAKTGSATTKYLYSLGTRPLAQNTTAWEYLLPDALGSVRQIADASGNVTLAKSYEPYGTVLTSTGTASSIFGYSGEVADTYIKLVFLRSRYYSPETGGFLSKDTWQGDYTRPQSLNGWGYVTGNPVMYTDPLGMFPCRDEDKACQSIQLLKPIIMDVARRLNQPMFTNMTTNGFAAMLAAKALHEGRLKGDWRADVLENFADTLGSDIRGDLSPSAPTSFGINNVYLDHPDVPDALEALKWWNLLISHQHNYGPLALTRDGWRGTLHTGYYAAKEEDFSDSDYHLISIPSLWSSIHGGGGSAWSVVPPDYYSRYTLANELTTAAGSFEFQGLIMLQQGWRAYEGYDPICWGANNGSPTSDISAFQIAVGVQTGSINRNDWSPHPPEVPGWLEEWVNAIPSAAAYLDLTVANGQDYVSYNQMDRQWFMQKGLQQP